MIIADLIDTFFAILPLAVVGAIIATWRARKEAKQEREKAQRKADHIAQGTLICARKQET